MTVHVISLLAALAASAYLSDMRERIFGVLYRAINSSSTELQKAGKDGLRKVDIEKYMYTCTM